MRVPNYLAKLLDQIAARGVQGSQIIPVEVLHDDDCPLILETGPCGCDPEVIIHGKPVTESKGGSA